MKQCVNILSIISITLMVFSCSPKNKIDLIENEHNSRNSLDWEGLYEGKLPCDDCPGVQTALNLDREGNYDLQMKHLENAKEDVSGKGTFDWSKDGNSIKLNVEGLDDKEFRFKVIENGLIKLDQRGKVPQGSSVDSYILGKNLKASLPIRGSWELKELLEMEINTSDFQKSPKITVDPIVMEIHGNDGCNQFRGTIEYVDEKRVSFTKLLGTRMACENMEQVNEINQLIGQVSTYEIKKSMLIFYNKSGISVLQFARDLNQN